LKPEQKYPHKHSGAALLVGYAPSVRVDVEAARRLRPDAPMLGVKYACVLYPEIEHVWTQHLEQANDIREKAGRPVYVHSRCRVNQKRVAWFTGGNEKHIDYLWPDLHWVSWSSGFAAALWARHGMGFDEVIMCGIPMEPGVYAPEMATVKQPRGDDGKSFVDTGALMRWRDGVMNFVREGKTRAIYSMSGWTCRELGYPPPHAPEPLTANAFNTKIGP
jgi:hypothetical protein